MAAYAALVSLMYIIEQLEHHPRPPISLDKQQVQFLTEKVTFLQEFLEGYSRVAGYNSEPDALESRIADAAYAAEDVIESCIVDQIRGSTSHGKKISSNDLYEGLQKVIEEVDSIREEVMETKEKMGVQDQLQRSSMPTGSSRSTSTGQNAMVGFDDVCLQIMDKLTGGQLARQIIPIVGMGGIGKTTLAKNIYQNQVVVEYFDILVWVTISQEYQIEEILLELLKEGVGNLTQMDEHELGDKLYKRLSGRRYLIIMDDIWDIKVWDQLKFFFPDNKNGSRIMLTTRLSNLVSQVADSYGIDMAFLDEDNSWNLFSKIVFTKEGCPFELEEIGKKIVKNCKGLPLSIVVIGGLLAKFKHTREFWEYIVKNLNSIVNSEDDESCFKILHMSYNQLPVYLKPCFLYMGVFSEDCMIHVSTLVKLWIAEGFLKPVSGKSLEVVGREYLKELINRNLILVHELGSTGNIKYCSIHDLLRDLCLKEAQKERFYHVQHSCLNVPQGLNTDRRLLKKVHYALQPVSLVRSLMSEFDVGLRLVNFRLLRIITGIQGGYSTGNIKGYPYGGRLYSVKDFLRLVNARYLEVKVGLNFPSSVYLLWNLQTLILSRDDSPSCIKAPAEIWNMPQLRHVIFRGGLSLPDPPSGHVGRRDDIVLGNLQTLVRITNLKCGEEVIKRIPNISKLAIRYDRQFEGCSLTNLEQLSKLESFGYYTEQITTPIGGTDNFLNNLTFPRSLKKLTLSADYSHWGDVLEKIGSLPLLQKLKLRYGSFRGGKWETVEGQFPSLKFLRICSCSKLEYWRTEGSHFPRLEHLVLRHVALKEIPSEIGEIPTLKSIVLSCCSDSAIISAKRVQEEQEELQGEVGSLVRVVLPEWNKNEALESLASPNFQVEWRTW